MDFTVKTYLILLNTLSNQGFFFQSFAEYIIKPKSKVIILRHDVDRLPDNSLKFAEIQNKFGIKGTYYFRVVNQNFNPEIIMKIAGLGHEIGYHYEDLNLAASDPRVKAMKDKSRKEEMLFKIAIESFQHNLSKLRRIVPVNTICMHGSPLSNFDNRDIWKNYDYKDYKILGDPFFEIDFSKILYLTDTGRRWNGKKVSLRDKISEQDLTSKNSTKTQRSLTEMYNFRSTYDIIQAAKSGKLPDQIMMTFHPQRWTNKPFPWMKELIFQNIKNIAKAGLVQLRKSNT